MLFFLNYLFLPNKVGYGDIIPSTIVETCFVIFAMIGMLFYLIQKLFKIFSIKFKVSCGIFAYTFNSIGSIIDSITEVLLLK